VHVEFEQKTFRVRFFPLQRMQPSTGRRPLARREMLSWTQLHLEPSALRAPTISLPREE